MTTEAAPAESVDAVFRGLSDPTRRQVFERLSQGPASVSELARHHHMALPSFVGHLRVMEQCGLVRSQKQGRVRTYQVAPRRIRLAEDWLARQRRFWEQRLDQLDEYLVKLKEGLQDMATSSLAKPDPKRDLVLERVIDVSPELVWKAWTEPEHIKHWFAPRPWSITACEVDLRPGGVFSSTMRSPEGEEFPNVGCYLEVVSGERLVWTDALLPGYRPSENPFFTAVITITPEGDGCRYVATAIHRDEAGRKKHEEMGFYDGWGTVLDQLVEYARTM